MPDVFLVGHLVVVFTILAITKVSYGCFQLQEPEVENGKPTAIPTPSGPAQHNREPISMLMMTTKSLSKQFGFWVHGMPDSNMPVS